MYFSQLHENLKCVLLASSSVGTFTRDYNSSRVCALYKFCNPQCHQLQNMTNNLIAMRHFIWVNQRIYRQDFSEFCMPSLKSKNAAFPTRTTASTLFLPQRRYRRLPGAWALRRSVAIIGRANPFVLTEVKSPSMIVLARVSYFSIVRTFFIVRANKIIGYNYNVNISNNFLDCNFMNIQWLWPNPKPYTNPKQSR